MENDMLQRKDQFPKTVTDPFRILSSWQKTYGNINTRLTEANEGVAFATTCTEENKGNEKKEITCHNCKKTSVKNMMRLSRHLIKRAQVS